MSRAKFKILFLYQTPWWNATAYYGVNLAAGIKAEGHDVFFGTSSKTIAWEKSEEYGLDRLDINLKAANPITIYNEISKLSKFIVDNQINLIYTLSPEGHSYYMIGSVLRKLKVPLVRACCDVRSPNGYFVNRYMYRNKVEKLIFPCTSNKDRYQKILNFPDEKAEIIYGAINLEKFDSEISEKFNRADLGIEENDFIIGSIARLSPVKGHEYFLRTAKRVLESIPNVKFLIIGAEREITIDQLTAEAKSLGIEKNVIITGYYPNPKPAYMDFDIAVIASRGSETISRAALEFMCAGKAIMSTDVNILGDIIVDGESGYKFTIHEQDEMADRITSLLRDQDALKKLGNRSRMYVEQNFSLKDQVKKNITIINGILDK